MSVYHQVPIHRRLQQSMNHLKKPASCGLSCIWPFIPVYPSPSRTIAAHWHAGHLYLSFLTKRLSIRAKHTSSPLDNVHSMPCP